MVGALIHHLKILLRVYVRGEMVTYKIEAKQFATDASFQLSMFVRLFILEEKIDW
jgi:hypothetical protein